MAVRQYRAVDSEDLSRWRCDQSLAVIDAALLIGDGEDGAYVERRRVTVPVRDERLTAEARRRAQEFSQASAVSLNMR